MIIRGGTGVRETLRLLIGRNWVAIAAILLLEAAIWAFHELYSGLEISSQADIAVGLLATIVGIFIAFRFNEAYARWWEARILWGGVVNASRTFARQITTLLTADRVPRLGSAERARDVQRELVYRQLAYVNALRLSLRRQPVLAELGAWLADDEIEALKPASNVPTMLLQRQGERLAELFAPDVAQQLLVQHLGGTLGQLTDLQGGVERIKNTAFPDRVIVVSRVLVWMVGVMVAFAFIDHNPGSVGFELIAIPVIIGAFVVVKQLGDELNNPFDNRCNDTPMTALCRTIEIDVRQQLGERDVPAPLEPVDGVLM